MIRNYIKIAFRNLMKYKFISGINLFGLTIGLACCLLILTYLLNELSFDRYKNAKNIYRVERTFLNPRRKPSISNLVQSLRLSAVCWLMILRRSKKSPRSFPMEQRLSDTKTRCSMKTIPISAMRTCLNFLMCI